MRRREVRRHWRHDISRRYRRPYSLRRSLTVLGLLCAAAAAIFGLPRGAQAAPPSPQAPQRSPSIPRAIGIYLTERGQNYLGDNLLDLIARQGYEITDGSFDGLAYEAKETIRLEELPVHLKPFASTLGEVRDIIRAWFKGFDLGDPLIRAEISSLSYSAKARIFGVRVDPEATARQRRRGAISLVFRAEIPKVRVALDTIRATDLSNAFLGPIGGDRFWAEIPSPGKPLRVIIPMTLRLDGKGGVELQLQDFETNLHEIDLDLGFDRPLLLPQASLTINGQRAPLNQAKLEQQLLKHRVGLLRALQTYLAQYARDTIPGALNEWLAGTEVQALFTDVNEMDPPDAPRGVTPKDRYYWGVRPEELRHTRDYLMLGLSGYVDDPRAKDPRAEVSRRHVTRPPVLDLIDPTTFDAALTVSEDLVNRILGLGYQRGYRPDLREQKLELLQAPEFRFDSSSGSDRGKLRLHVFYEPQDLMERMAIRKPKPDGGARIPPRISFEMDIKVRLVHTRKGKVSVVADGIDLGSLDIDMRNVRKPFHGQLRASLVNKLTESSHAFAKNPKVIVNALPVPSKIAGIPIRVKDFRADPNGYIVLYFEYDLPSSKGNAADDHP